LLAEAKFSSDPYLQAFTVGIDGRMIDCNGRVLNAPNVTVDKKPVVYELY